MIIRLVSFVMVCSIVFSSCGNNPKVISSSTEHSTTTTNETGIFSDAPTPSPEAQQSFGSNLHTVVVEEILETSKYVYLYVNEGEKHFWIATNRQAVNIGETYFYRDGLLKTNFESKEHNRIFDTVYLVASLVSSNHGTQNTAQSASNTNQKIDVETHSGKPVNNVKPPDGVTTIAELVANPEKYEGKKVVLHGKCSKINHNIMGRNWIHLKDGSHDDYDLVITSDAAVPQGHVISIAGIVTLNRDFGAGYRYDIILEEGKIVH